MITIEVDDSRVMAWMTDMPDKVRRVLYRVYYELAERLRNHVVQDKLMGQVLNRVTGRLGQSIQQLVTQTDTSIIGEVFSSGDVKYAAIHEFGGRTAAHVIEARNAEALAFNFHGKMVFAKKVNHPGSLMPERSFMRSSLRDMRDDIIHGTEDAVREGTQP